MARDEGTQAVPVTGRHRTDRGSREPGPSWSAERDPPDRGHPPAAAHRTAAHRRRPRRDSVSRGHRARERDPHQSGSCRVETVLRRMPATGRAACRGPAGGQRRCVPALRHAVLVLAAARSRRDGRRPVRCPGLHRTRRRRLDLPGDRPQRERPVGGAQGPPPPGRRASPGDRCRRTPIPRHGEPSGHRQDLQLRRTPGLRRPPNRLHRDGVRRRHDAAGHPDEAASGGAGKANRSR